MDNNNFTADYVREVLVPEIKNEIENKHIPEQLSDVFEKIKEEIRRRKTIRSKPVSHIVYYYLYPENIEELRNRGFDVQKYEFQVCQWEGEYKISW